MSFAFLGHTAQFHHWHCIINSKPHIKFMSNTLETYHAVILCVLIRSCHGPYRLSCIPLAGTCYHSIAKKVFQLIHNIYCRIVECQFVLISIFGARTKPCTNLLCFMQRQAIYFCVCHSQVPSHYHVWHDFIIPTRGTNGIATYLKRNVENYFQGQSLLISQQ